MEADRVIGAALTSLAGDRHAYADAIRLVPKRPGLYAFYGDERAWADLELSSAFEDQPLYVGKAERSLNGRDVGTHFSAGKTGSSTVRRSLAALLVNELDLLAVPRNRAKPDGSANFALHPAGEERLSQWMERRLSLATWCKPDGIDLDALETTVVRQLHPPLNLDKVGERRTELREARRRLADIAKAWKPRGETPNRTGGELPAE